MKSVKLNEFLSSINKLETIDCYYWKNYVIGEQYEINYKTLQEEILNEITTNLYSVQPHQTNFYFNQLFKTIENIITSKDISNLCHFGGEASEDYEFQLEELVSKYADVENLDDEINYLIYTPIKEIFKTIFFDRIEKRLNLINSLKSKIETLKSIYFDQIENSEEITIDKLNEIKKNANSIIDKKLKWKGTPAQFCFIIDLLIEKGYIEKPTNYSERSGKLLLNHFEFENDKPTFESLGKYLHKDLYAINNQEHIALFNKIPHRKDLDK